VSVLSRVAATGSALAFTAALVIFSGLPYEPEPGEDALIRLSWRAVGERIEECREPSEAELAALPQHMRMKEICEGRLAPFHLEVAVDGRTLFDGRIRASGAREDRPTYVLQEFRVPPGEHRLRIHFEVDRPGASAPSGRGPLTFDETIRLAPRAIALIAHDEDSGRLTVFEPAGR